MSVPTGSALFTITENWSVFTQVLVARLNGSRYGTWTLMICGSALGSVGGVAGVIFTAPTGGRAPSISSDLVLSVVPLGMIV